VRLQRRQNRIIGESAYSKWIVTIPPAQIAELGWKEGDYLESEIKGEELALRRVEAPENNPKPERMSYEEFKSKIAEALKTAPDGLSWTQIKQQLGLPQRVPNNLWVRMMEKDISLSRVKDQKTGKTLWRLATIARSA